MLLPRSADRSANRSAGDSISFADHEPHQLRNDGKVEARAIVCVIGDHEGQPDTGGVVRRLMFG